MSAPTFRMCVVSALLVLGAARSSVADPVVIYSNFGPPPGYLPGSPDHVLQQRWVSSEENAYYMGFQLTEAALLSSVTVPVAWAPGAGLPADFSASLYSSSGGAPNFSTGGLIEQIVVPFPADTPSGTIRMLTFSSSLQPMLNANTLYFLGVIPTRIAGPVWWFGTLWPWNNAGIQGIVVNHSPGGMSISQGTLGAFQLNGEPNAVPEPATMLLFATGAGFVLHRVRRRRWA
jgi:PEP-CTERM motif-containing protein